MPAPAASSAVGVVAASKTSPPDAAKTALDDSPESEFTRRGLSVFQKLDPKGGWTVKEELTLRGPQDSEVNLDKAFRVCHREGFDCDAFLRDFAARTIDMSNHEPSAASPSALVAILRDKQYVESIPDAQRRASLVEPFVGELSIVYVFDDPTSVRVARTEDLAAIGATRETMSALARENLAARLPATGFDHLKCSFNSVDTLETANFFESSRLLVTAPWAALTAKTKRRVVVAVPSTESLVVMCDPSAQMLGAVRRAVDETFAEAEAPVSRSFFKWTPKGWQEMKP